jgi:precorrin-3B C17-methyltransferase
MSERAREVLKLADTVAGYTTYIDLIRPLIADKEIISTTMMKEGERVEAAIAAALSGKSCAIISSGDPGIYAMAGLVFEMCKEKNILIRAQGAGRRAQGAGCPNNQQPISSIQHPASSIQHPASSNLYLEVVPGIPALCAGASLLGSPLTHDFAVISLSDLLTPWEKIEQRIEAAAKADFVIVIYNPKSKKRNWQLEAAQKIILKYRDKNTPVGIVTSAMREEQEVQMVALEELHTAPVNMQTTVFVGSSASVAYLDFMITPRGYTKKYSMGSE